MKQQPGPAMTFLDDLQVVPTDPSMWEVLPPMIPGQEAWAVAVAVGRRVGLALEQGVMLSVVRAESARGAETAAILDAMATYEPRDGYTFRALAVRLGEVRPGISVGAAPVEMTPAHNYGLDGDAPDA